MAVTLTQQPTTPNAAYTRLVYVLSGSVTTSNPQYQYVMDVYESGSTDRIARLTQTPNPFGVAVFDPSRIIQGELQEDGFWKTVGASGSSNSGKEFEIKFGEQYGTSVSSSVTVYPDLISDNIDIIPAVVDPNNGVSYNFQSGSYLPEPGNLNTALTNDPLISSSPIVYKPIGINDWQTISYINEGNSYPTFDVFIYSNDNIVASVFNEPLTYDTTSNLAYIGVGPQNLIQMVPALATGFAEQWSHYEVRVDGGTGSSHSTYYVNEAINPTLINQIVGIGGTSLIDTEIQPIDHREKVRFAWINKFGVWDYYNNYNPVRRSSNIQRENVTLPQVDYSNISSPYNINTRGEKSYYTKVEDKFNVETALLGKDLSNWLEELLQSPSVYIQRGDKFIPIVITNSSYTANTDEYRQKLFQYNIEFVPANQSYGEWTPEFIVKECPDFIYKAIYSECDGAAPTIQLFSSASFTFPSNIYNGEYCYTLTSRGGDGTDGDIDLMTVYEDCPECDTANFTYTSLGYQVTDPTCNIISFPVSTPEQIKCALMYNITPISTYSIKYRIGDTIQVGTRLYNSNTTPFTSAGNYSFNPIQSSPEGCFADALYNVTGGQVLTVDGSGYITAINNFVDITSCSDPYTAFKSTVTLIPSSTTGSSLTPVTYNNTPGSYYQDTAWASAKGCDLPQGANFDVVGTGLFTKGAIVYPPSPGSSRWVIGTKDLVQNAPYATEYVFGWRENPITDCGDAKNVIFEKRDGDFPYCQITPFLDYKWRHYFFSSQAGITTASPVTDTYPQILNYSGNFDECFFAYDKLEVGSQLYTKPDFSNAWSAGAWGDFTQYVYVKTPEGDFAMDVNTSGVIQVIYNSSGQSVSSLTEDIVMYEGPFFFYSSGSKNSDPYLTCIASMENRTLYVDPPASIDSITSGSGYKVYNNYNSADCTVSNPFDGDNEWFKFSEWNPQWQSSPAPDTVVRIDNTGSIVEIKNCADVLPTYYLLEECLTGTLYRTDYFASSTSIPDGTIMQWEYSPDQYSYTTSYFTVSGSTDNAALPTKTLGTLTQTAEPSCPQLYEYRVSDTAGNGKDTRTEACQDGTAPSIPIWSPRSSIGSILTCDRFYASQDWNDIFDGDQKYYGVSNVGATEPYSIMQIGSDLIGSTCTVNRGRNQVLNRFIFTNC